MSAFTAEWLALREPYDLVARNATVLEAVGACFLEQTSVSVVDLACGTGATLRAIGPHLPPSQHWRMVDNDLGLLARAATSANLPYVSVVAKPLDLVRDLELALEGPLDLVTASALLDLVSPAWLDRLIVEAAARRLPVYAALTYDGGASVEPDGLLDAELVAGFNLHQRTDKGFGAALGPAAPEHARERFEHFGYQVVQGRSDWILGPDDRPLQEAVFSSWAELGPLTTAIPCAEISGWLARRRGYLCEGRSYLRVGHIDVFARPITSR